MVTTQGPGQMAQTPQDDIGNSKVEVDVVGDHREIMLFFGKPKGRLIMISNGDHMMFNHHINLSVSDTFLVRFRVLHLCFGNRWNLTSLT